MFQHIPPLLWAIIVTALAAGMLGLPIVAPRYGRVYAAASCTQSPTGTIDASTSFNCTVSSGSVNQPQVFYTGYGIWYKIGRAHV